MIGEVAKERLITTAGARVGDKVLLVNGVPIEGTAIIAREKATELSARGYDEAFIARAQDFLHAPGISVLAAARLAAAYDGVSAMHDPTEGGLATGLHELAHAADAGLVLHLGAVPVLAEGRRLCAEYGLDPLGVIASGALIVAVAPERAQGLLELYARAGLPCACVGELLPAAEGVWAERDGVRVPLPRYDTDEIARIL
jgi:hydrogenase maturation factor